MTLAVEWALTQAVDPGHDGPTVAVLSKFDADGLFDGLTLSNGSLELVIDFGHLDPILFIFME